jgi:hypothetical protein
MHSRISQLVVVAISLLTAAMTDLGAQTTTIAGQSLNIGPVSTNNLHNTTFDQSGAIGTGNYSAAPGSLALGQSNTITSFNTITLGYGNTSWGDDTLQVGEVNSSDAKGSLLVGGYNSAFAGEEAGPVWYSIVSGNLNNVNAASNVLVTGLNNGVTASNSATLGRGLVNYWENATIVGAYNNTTVSDPLRFAVGNGSTASDRSNAFEVYANGTILMPRQGDVRMGRFGVGSDQ